MQQGKPLPHLCSKLLYDSDFLLMSALCHPDGGALREMATVEVPVQVPCKAPQILAPAWAAAELKAADSLEVKVRALLAERRQRIGYERELIAANEACR